eukprot:g4634.t1
MKFQRDWATYAYDPHVLKYDLAVNLEDEYDMLCWEVWNAAADLDRGICTPSTETDELDGFDEIVDAKTGKVSGHCPERLLSMSKHDEKKSRVPEELRKPADDVELIKEHCPICKKPAVFDVPEAIARDFLRATHDHGGLESCTIATFDKQRRRNPYCPRIRISPGCTVGEALLAFATSCSAINIMELLTFGTVSGVQTSDGRSLLETDGTAKEKLLEREELRGSEVFPESARRSILLRNAACAALIFGPAGLAAVCGDLGLADWFLDVECDKNRHKDMASRWDHNRETDGGDAQPQSGEADATGNEAATNNQENGERRSGSDSEGELITENENDGDELYDKCARRLRRLPEVHARFVYVAYQALAIADVEHIAGGEPEFHPAALEHFFDWCRRKATHKSHTHEWLWETHSLERDRSKGSADSLLYLLQPGKLHELGGTHFGETIGTQLLGVIVRSAVFAVSSRYQTRNGCVTAYGKLICKSREKYKGGATERGKRALSAVRDAASRLLLHPKAVAVAPSRLVRGGGSMHAELQSSDRPHEAADAENAAAGKEQSIASAARTESAIAPPASDPYPENVARSELPRIVQHALGRLVLRRTQRENRHRAFSLMDWAARLPSMDINRPAGLLIANGMSEEAVSRERDALAAIVRERTCYTSNISISKHSDTSTGSSSKFSASADETNGHSAPRVVADKNHFTELSNHVLFDKVLCSFLDPACFEVLFFLIEECGADPKARGLLTPADGVSANEDYRNGPDGLLSHVVELEYGSIVEQLVRCSANFRRSESSIYCKHNTRAKHPVTQMLHDDDDTVTELPLPGTGKNQTVLPGVMAGRTRRRNAHKSEMNANGQPRAEPLYCVQSRASLRALQTHLYDEELSYCLRQNPEFAALSGKERRLYALRFKLKKRTLRIYDVVAWLALDKDVDIQEADFKRLAPTAEDEYLHPRPEWARITADQFSHLQKLQREERRKAKVNASGP